jgi:hypothetical protein
MLDDFWSYLFVLCHALYAPMRVLCLADQNTPAMDKLYFYMLQTDIMLPKWLGELDEHSSNFLTQTTVRVMGNIQSAGDSSDSEGDDGSEDDSKDENEVEFEEGPDTDTDEDDIAENIGDQR